MGVLLKPSSRMYLKGLKKYPLEYIFEALNSFDTE